MKMDMRKVQMPLLMLKVTEQTYQGKYWMRATEQSRVIKLAAPVTARNQMKNKLGCRGEKKERK